MDSYRKDYIINFTFILKSIIFVEYVKRNYSNELNIWIDVSIIKGSPNLRNGLLSGRTLTLSHLGLGQGLTIFGTYDISKFL